MLRLPERRGEPELPLQSPSRHPSITTPNPLNSQAALDQQWPPLSLAVVLSRTRCLVISQVRVQLNTLHNTDGPYDYRSSPVSTVDGSGNPDKLAYVWN